MYFKPRIFLSSTLKENLNVRSEIEEFFNSIGAEALLYEKNLTPSVTPMTYRKDILEADFVIFIIKNEYGKLTDTGKSGTHEELDITLTTNIPKHVYIKRDAEEEGPKELIEEINKNQISYFYFRNDADLLKRIKETSCTIIKEIVLNQVQRAQLPRNSVRMISSKHDYKVAIDIIKIIKEMMRLHENSDYDFIDSSILSSFIEPIKWYKKNQEWFFVDQKKEKLIDDMLKLYEEFFEKHCNNYSRRKDTDRRYNIELLGEIEIYYCTADSHGNIRDELKKLLDKFFDKYLEFYNYVSSSKLESDTLRP